MTAAGRQCGILEDRCREGVEKDGKEGGRGLKEGGRGLKEAPNTMHLLTVI